tara:strand:+ start:1100 stop:2725 length:1626 start_codon:yes stop_codon:yes gene_type:complete
MKFGKVPTKNASGSVLAHTTHSKSRIYKKGHTINDEDVNTLLLDGIDEITVATLEPYDISENEAASQISKSLAGSNIKVTNAFTGRANLVADKSGLVIFEQETLHKINLVDQSITVATLQPYDRVEPGQLIATIKIIPLAISKQLLEKVMELISSSGSLVSVAPFVKKRISLILTQLSGTKDSVLKKTKANVIERISSLGCEELETVIIPHDENTVTSSIKTLAKKSDIILMSGASAVVDSGDVLPNGLVLAGGKLHHFGMPVDPGNLLFTGTYNEIPVIGMPGCARSPQLNGFDWVLWRLIADVQVTSKDIMMMGVGGLLKETINRGQPRENNQTPKLNSGMEAKIVGLVLAAGSSKRMGDTNKLIAEVKGKPMLNHILDALRSTNLQDVLVVTGYQNRKVEEVIENKKAKIIYNPDHKKGLSSSLKKGLDALPKNTDGILVCLGDMPLITAQIIEKLILSFDPVEGRSICIPVVGRKRGNPVLWSSKFFPEIKKISGDIGAKTLLDTYSDEVYEVPINQDEILIDIDTPESLDSINNAK